MIYLRLITAKLKGCCALLQQIMAVIFLFLLLTAPSKAFFANDATSIPPAIGELFPSATRVGPALYQAKVTPVYQLSELLGYTFESDDFTQIIGFSGQTINLLIAIDPDGILVKLKIINHHEPIFLHGLGEQPMIDFVNQYQGHSIKERIVIGRGQSDQDTTFFDGVTKATVSVLVINDTIITAALKVARSLLDGFTVGQLRELDLQVYRQQSFDQLVSAGYISHWQLSKSTVLKQHEHLSVALESYGDDNLVDLYLAFVNVPIIGRNLLGKTQYQRLITELKPGDHALMIFNRGEYAFIDEQFIPQTVPVRLKLVQDKLPVSLRDIDFYSYQDPSFASGFEQLNQFEPFKIFAIKSQSGFDLSREIKLGLGLSYSQSFLSQKKHWFEYSMTLPQDLFKPLKLTSTVKPLALWQKIWLNRITEIVVLVVYLLVVLFLFIRSKQVTNNSKLFIRARLAALIFTVLFIGLYAQGQLSVVNILTLINSLLAGFKLEVFLLDPIIFILWLVVFVSLFIWGRGLFCGWLCPFGALQELTALVANKLAIKQIRIAPGSHLAAQKIKYLVLVSIIASMFYSLSLAEQLAEIEPFKTTVTLLFVRYWPFIVYAVLLLLLSLKIHKFYCRYLCPLGAGLAVLGLFPLVKWIPRRQECGSPCQLCKNKKCQIDAIKPSGQINYGECIGCFDCVVTISSPQLCVIDKYQNKHSHKIMPSPRRKCFPPKV